MTIVRRNTAYLVLLLLASTPLLRAQTQTGAQAKPAANCPDLPDFMARMKSQSRQLKDWPALSRYREANAKLSAPAKDEQRVVFMGDSITDMWVLPEFGGFFPGKPYIGRGIGGQTTPQMLVRFRPDVIALHPCVVVILAGTNDIAGNTGPMTLEETEGNLSSMAELARANGIRVVLSSVMPVSNYGHTPEGNPLDMRLKRPPEKILELNAWIRKYAAVNDHIYLDYFSAMVDGQGMLKKELSEDGLHPNAAGYALMAPLAEKAIQSALHEMPASSFGFQAPVPVARQTEQEQMSELYGLYYAELGEQEKSDIRLVINADGKPIPKDPRDPDAPTLPGLYVNGRHFKFARSEFSLKGFAFRTENIDGTEYSFEGKFGHERVDIIPDVPYLAGVLTEKRKSRVALTKKVHFGHAVGE